MLETEAAWPSCKVFFDASTPKFREQEASADWNGDLVAEQGCESATPQSSSTARSRGRGSSTATTAPPTAAAAALRRPGATLAVVASPTVVRRVEEVARQVKQMGWMAGRGRREQSPRKRRDRERRGRWAQMPSVRKMEWG